MIKQTLHTLNAIAPHEEAGMDSQEDPL